MGCSDCDLSDYKNPLGFIYLVRYSILTHQWLGFHILAKLVKKYLPLMYHGKIENYLFLFSTILKYLMDLDGY